MHAVLLVSFAGYGLRQPLDLFKVAPLAIRLNLVLECSALLTIAVAALELARTILKEERTRDSQTNPAARARCLISRFWVVVIVALSVEVLVATFQFLHDDPAKLPQAAIIAFGAAVLLASWRLLIRLNRSAEELEPKQRQVSKLKTRVGPLPSYALSPLGSLRFARL